ncbi:MAG: hypothetical protein JO340_16155 [Acidobacteriaceae bacterium]|nr:hypothetical protein [Acidobacteriaceae bacterium]
MFRSLVLALLATSALRAADWSYSKWTNPMSGKLLDRFALQGRYLSRPALAEDGTPSLLAFCSEGQFRNGEFQLGAVAQPVVTYSLKGAPQAQIHMRIGSHAVETGFWEYSNNGQVLFFDRNQFDKLLTGKLLGHPSRAGSLVSAVVLGVVESAGNEVVVQFDMPANDSALISECGLEWGKEKRSGH